MKKYLSFFKIFGWLLWRDVRKIKQNFGNSLIDALLIPCSIIIVSGYILPHMGIDADYGAFMVVSSMAIMCYDGATWFGAGTLIADLEGDRAIDYELSLPVPAWAVFVKYAFAFAIKAAVLNILTLPMGKLLLGSKFNLAYLSLPKFIFMYATVVLFLGFYALFIASFVKGMEGLGRFHLRVGWQLVIFSGFQFPWYTLYKIAPMLANIDLLNPMVYVHEGLRVAVLGPEGALNYWFSAGALWASIIIFGSIAVALFAKRLNCVK